MTVSVHNFQAIARLIFRWFLLGVVVLIGIVVAILAAVLGSEWYSYGRHAAKIETVMSVDGSFCTDPEYPFYIGFINRSPKTLERVDFTFAARRPGRSLDVSKFQMYADDTVIRPGDQKGTCWKIPALKEDVTENPRTLDWSFGSKRYRFAD